MKEQKNHISDHFRCVPNDCLCPNGKTRNVTEGLKQFITQAYLNKEDSPHTTCVGLDP